MYYIKKKTRNIYQVRITKIQRNFPENLGFLPPMSAISLKSKHRICDNYSWKLSITWPDTRLINLIWIIMISFEVDVRTSRRTLSRHHTGPWLRVLWARHWIVSHWFFNQPHTPLYCSSHSLSTLPQIQITWEIHMTDNAWLIYATSCASLPINL